MVSRPRAGSAVMAGVDWVPGMFRSFINSSDGPRRGRGRLGPAHGACSMGIRGHGGVQITALRLKKAVPSPAAGVRLASIGAPERRAMSISPRPAPEATPWARGL